MKIELVALRLTNIYFEKYDGCPDPQHLVDTYRTILNYLYN